MAQSIHPGLDESADGSNVTDGSNLDHQDHQEGCDVDGTTYMHPDKLEALKVSSFLGILKCYNPELQRALGLCEEIQLSLEPIYSTISTHPSNDTMSARVQLRERIVQDFCAQLDCVVRNILRKVKKIRQAPLLFFTPDKQKRDLLRKMTGDYLKNPEAQHSGHHLETILLDIQKFRAKF